jgi:hypothetical protein
MPRAIERWFSDHRSIALFALKSVRIMANSHDFDHFRGVVAEDRIELSTYGL